ncbi:BTB/POZ domain-containing protein 18 [Collichthys lucidus]|uniref:BTB/POZ domain-containing protein 18 n=1 Tax=Collichthys lucidus TaxID=240159 RepID=A0A4U5UE92_COLLU|nr:BTB/POZ domain-containing protein 18 [Collichthys lucidus]
MVVALVYLMQAIIYGGPFKDPFFFVKFNERLAPAHSKLFNANQVDGEMWCYKIPGFEALLLTELQRQQQCRQFCDVLLKTEGVSVPAHSCILSAISPHISAAVSSTPSPPAGQSRLLDLQSLDACSLLHMVRLMYSGEMVGEREEEKQEAISAAARLGIHGLVQVTRRVCKCRHEEGEGRHAEVGVQTEPEENERGRCRREMRDGCTFLWKEKLSGGGRETWTQTEEQAGSYPAASFETIDLAALQDLRQTDTGLPHSQIPYVPMSLVYPQDENQAHQSSSATVDTMQESTATVVAPPYTSLRPFSSLCAADPQSWCSAPQRTGGNVPAAEEWTDEHFLQFQGNIPGYINYFLNPAKEESPSRGRARKRRGARVGGARRAGTGESRARKPRASRGGRGRGGLMQTVDVQEVKEGKLQKLFLHRWGMRASRMGQGGGAAGKKLYLKTRELLKPVKKRIRRTKGLDFSPDGDVPLHSEEGAAPSFLHTTPIPPPAPPPPEEHFDRLLEEVMMGLDILPNNNSASHSQPPLLARSSTNASSGSTLTRNKQQGRAADLLEAGPGFHRSTQVEVTAGGSNCADSEGPILQQQREGELNEMLENLLLSFEQHADSCAATEEMEVGGQSCREVMNDEAESHAARAHSAVTVGTQEKVKKAAKQRKRKRKNEFPFSFEKKRVRKPELSSDAKTKMIHDQQEKQLQQMPVVKLERSGPLPVRVTLRGSGSHYLEVKSAMFSSSSVRCRHDKNKQVFSGLKMYPIRSRFREARMVSIGSFYESEDK